jgi:hypothetical protein
MDKKILICGSAIAVVVLVLASLSPVVGYNSIKSSAKDSPLFNVRTKRAINEESETLTCNYLRKGLLMPFPTRNSKTALIQNMIDKIKNMDDKTFLKFVVLVAERYEKQLTNMEFSLEEILDVFYLIRETPYKSFVLHNLIGKEFNLPYYTLDGTLKCTIIWILVLLGEIVYVLFIILYDIIVTIIRGCHVGK